MVNQTCAPSEVVQVIDTITPDNPHSEQSGIAKTLLKDSRTWGGVPNDESALVHGNSRMTCNTCHTAWTTSCFGCHLPMTANTKLPMLHNEGLTTRNYTACNFEGAARRHSCWASNVPTGHRIAPTRSACAVVVRLAERQSRLAVLYAADDLRRGFQQLRLQPLQCAHRARH
jgi:hypothetical protein